MTTLVLIGQSIAIVWLLILLGMTERDLGRRIDRASRHLQMTDKPEDPKPICGCQHHQCFHDENGCGSVREYYSAGESRQITCGCKRYTGPEPLPTVLP